MIETLRRELAGGPGTGPLADAGRALPRCRAACSSPPTSRSRHPSRTLEYGYTPDPLAEHVASLERARALEPSRLLPGHGQPTTDAAEQARHGARRHGGRSRARPRASIAASPRSAYEVIDEILGPTCSLLPAPGRTLRRDLHPRAARQPRDSGSGGRKRRRPPLPCDRRRLSAPCVLPLTVGSLKSALTRDRLPLS